jgi:class I fructose-bisphosphate aldolase
MRISQKVKRILDNYESDNPGTKGNLARILMHGKLGGTGRLVILRSTRASSTGRCAASRRTRRLRPHYHFQLAVDAGLNAYAAPLGMIEAGADSFAARSRPSSRSTRRTRWRGTKDQAVTGSVRDALRLGCSAIGFTIYPGSDDQFGDDGGDPRNGRGGQGAAA